MAYISISRKSIVSWYMPEFFNLQLVGEQVKILSFHVTYHVDGNIHFTYKYQNEYDKKLYEKRVYFDYVAIVQKDENGAYIDKNKSLRSDDDSHQILVPREKQTMLGASPLLFVFPQGGTILNERVLNEINEVIDSARVNDLNIDVNGCEGRMLNYGFYIYDNTRKEFITNIDREIIKKKQVFAFNNVVIEGYIFVV